MKLLSLLLFFPALLHAATIETVAGTGSHGNSPDGTKATEAELNQPFGVTVGPDGNLYFCDTENHSIKRLDLKTGQIETVVGTGTKGFSGNDGPPREAALNEPYEIVFHPSGDLYWVERMSHSVRRLEKTTGLVRLMAGIGKEGFSGDGGPATDAALNQPHSLCFDAAGESLFICDIKNHRIRGIELASGKIETLCGTGEGKPTPDGAPLSPETPLNGPRALTGAPDGTIYLALREGNAIYRLDLEKQTLHHLAGTGKNGFTGNGGPAKEATLSGPKGLAVSPDGSLLYLADTESHSIRAVTLADPTPRVVLIAGTGEKGDGPDSPDPLACKMNRPHGVGVDPATGDLYIGDSSNHKVRRISAKP